MKALIIYYSRFGNTKRIAEAVTEGFRRSGEVTLAAWDAVTLSDYEAVDLIILGLPTHKMNTPKDMRSFFDDLPKKLLKKKRVAAFDTAYELSPFLSRFTPSKKVLGKLKGRRIADPVTFHVAEREGPLLVGEIDRAASWGESLVIAMNA